MIKDGWEAIIGMEIHAQLATATKIFCGCAVQTGGEPNANTCPVCLGLPGALPVLNRRVIELGAKAAMSLGLEIQETSIFARKNYFYPDLPKGYQISQYDSPFSANGNLTILTSERDDQGRAVEQGAPLIRVANTGISTVIDRYGRPIAGLGLGKSGVVDVEFHRHYVGATTIFGRLGNTAPLAALLSLVVVWLALNAALPASAVRPTAWSILSAEIVPSCRSSMAGR